MSQWPGWAQAVLFLVILVGFSVASYFVVMRSFADRPWWQAQNPAIRARLASLPGGLLAIGVILLLILAFHLHVGG